MNITLKKDNVVRVASTQKRVGQLISEGFTVIDVEKPKPELFDITDDIDENSNADTVDNADETSNNANETADIVDFLGETPNNANDTADIVDETAEDKEPAADTPKSTSKNKK